MQGSTQLMGPCAVLKSQGCSGAGSSGLKSDVSGAPRMGFSALNSIQMVQEEMLGKPGASGMVQEEQREPGPGFSLGTAPLILDESQRFRQPHEHVLLLFPALRSPPGAQGTASYISSPGHPLAHSTTRFVLLFAGLELAH